MQRLLDRVAEAARDVELDLVRRWKEEHPGRRAIGYMPIWAPREIVRAAGMLPVGLLGAGDQLEIIKGDAYFQSYICHIPRSTTELGVTGRLDVLDGVLFPSICDVIRNLSGMWKVLFPDKYVRYFDFPQASDPAVAEGHCLRELEAIREGLERLGSRPITETGLWEAIADYNENARLVRGLYELRGAHPWQAPASEAYEVMRAGCVLDVEEHTAILREYVSAASGSDRPRMDNIRVILTGSFCEQPPLGLLRTLERAGCELIDDDLILGNRFIREEVPPGAGEPLAALARAFVRSGAPTASRYAPREKKGAWLVEKVKRLRADGVIFAAASFCDPALLEEPMLREALDRAGIPHTSFKFSEDTGQFQSVREQAGTFADSIRLWSGA